MFGYAYSIASRMARGRWMTELPTEGEHWSNHRAWPWQCDFNWHLNNALYLRNAELARWQWFARSRQIRAFYGEKMSFVVGSQLIVHTRAVPFMSSHRIRTRTLGVDGGWLFVAQDFFLNSAAKNLSDDKSHAAGVLLMAAILRRGKRVAPETFFSQMLMASDSPLAEQVETLKQQSRWFVRARGQSQTST